MQTHKLNSRARTFVHATFTYPNTSQRRIQNRDFHADLIYINNSNMAPSYPNRTLFQILAIHNKFAFDRILCCCCCRCREPAHANSNTQTRL